jgi:acetyl-CoA carboxylase carboxyltransferase component
MMNDRKIAWANAQIKLSDTEGKAVIQQEKVFENREAHQAHMRENEQKMRMNDQKAQMTAVQAQNKQIDSQAQSEQRRQQHEMKMMQPRPMGRQ